MNNWGSQGITAMIVLIAFMLIGVTAASVLTGDTTSSVTEEDVDQLMNEVVDELCSYIQIRDQKGKYYKNDGQFEIQKIALLISPLVSQNIDLSQLTVQIDNGEMVKILTNSDICSKLESNTLFDHSIWDNLDGENFGFISIIDLDNSIKDFNVINENSDNAYIVFKLPSDFTMQKRDKIIVKLFPSEGVVKTIILEAPLPMTLVVTFE